MSNVSRPSFRAGAGALLTILLVAACGTGTSPGASGPPGASPPAPSGRPPASTVPSPTGGAVTGAIEHKTGPTDVLLRVAEGGGFVPIEFNAAAAPSFTLYGDGIVVFQPIVATFPEPDAKGVVHSTPWRTAKLDEGQIQELLEYALGAGGLGAARDHYANTMVADAPSTFFTVRAGGVDKTVTVDALFEIAEPGPDQAIRTAFYRLSQRLKDFDRGGSIPSDVYQPGRFRGVLVAREAQPQVAPIDWPWPDLEVADFRKGAEDGSGVGGPAFPHRVMTAEEIAALRIDGTEGGLQGPVLKAPDGKLYTFILRPLLVDEAS